MPCLSHDTRWQARLNPRHVQKRPRFSSPLVKCVGTCRYLESAVKMMGRDKEGVDAAMAGFMSMLEDDKDSVPALLGVSLAFTFEDSPNKVCLQSDAAVVYAQLQQTLAFPMLVAAGR